jgi:hypothetical protein
MITGEKKRGKLLWRLAAIAIVVTFLASIGIVWLGGANPDSAGVPYLLSYQGVLADQLGDPVSDGTYQMTFSIYENATGGSALWSETRTVQVTDGRFSILMGNVTPIPPGVFLNGSERWLGVQVESDAEMTPRQRLASIAYAYVAEYARNPLAPGQGLVITDTDGNVTHRLNANGTSWHAGLETFDGGINVTGPHQSPHGTCTITDEGTYYFDENGCLEMEILANGIRRQWDENGTLREEKLANGTYRRWDENGVLRIKASFDCNFLYGPGDDESRMEIDYAAIKTYNAAGEETVYVDGQYGTSSQTGTHTVHTDGQGTTSITTEGVEATTTTSSGVKTAKLSPTNGLEIESVGGNTVKLSSTNGLEIGSTTGWTVKRRSLQGQGYIEEYFDVNGTKRKEVRASEGGPGESVFTHIFYDQAGYVVRTIKSYPNGQTIVTDGTGKEIRTESMDGSSSQTGKHTVQATGSDKRVEIGPDALRMYNAAGDETVYVDSEYGRATFKGDATFWGTDNKFEGDAVFFKNVYLYGAFMTGVRIEGNLEATGTKNAVVSTRNYGNRTTYCDESAEVYFFDRGEAYLDDGVVTVELDPIFLETVTIDDTHPMLVQLTPTAECNGLYVAQRTTSNFTVQELHSGSSDAGFMWEVAAKRTGYEDTRLAEAN